MRIAVLLAAALAAVRVEPQSSGVTARLRGISAVSSSVAWASGAGGTILRNSDNLFYEWPLLDRPPDSVMHDKVRQSRSK